MNLVAWLASDCRCILAVWLVCLALPFSHARAGGQELQHELPLNWRVSNELERLPPTESSMTWRDDAPVFIPRVQLPSENVSPETRLDAPFYQPNQDQSLWEPSNTESIPVQEPWASVPDFEFEEPDFQLVKREDLKGVQRFKKGFFQRLSLGVEWNDPAQDTGLGITHLNASLTVAIPMGSFDNLLLVTPNFDVALTNAAPGIDIPYELYDTGVSFLWRRQYNKRWGWILSVSPGYASDTHNSRNAIRIRGLALVTYQMVPERLQFMFGIAYLDRNDIPAVPGVGLIWTPNPDVKLELVFPRPKFSYRIDFIPTVSEHWVYFGGQLGGRTWAVERAGRVKDELTLRDYRLYAGWERIVQGGGGIFAEVGLSLGRELEYEIQPLDVSFDDAVFVRAGINF